VISTVFLPVYRSNHSQEANETAGANANEPNASEVSTEHLNGYAWAFGRVGFDMIYEIAGGRNRRLLTGGRRKKDTGTYGRGNFNSSYIKQPSKHGVEPKGGDLCEIFSLINML
jgi:hypothetical protein